MTQTAPLEVVQPRLFRNTGIRASTLDDDAVKVVQRLRRKGHESFLVGGCVRDLLLRRTPKDFDVATSARPRQVKSLFRNCRIIGRRFKLAHLHFDDKILEVSTFRRRPEQDAEDDDLLITSDNAFGTANEDAHRRDFTINALLFSPEEDCIHDYVGGIEDIEARVVRTIGDPIIRIREDPVRILRAIKFAARLSLTIEDATWEAMCEAAEDLSRAAPPRLLEELLKLLRSGTALRGFQLLRDCGALEVWMPEISDFLLDATRAERTHFWRMVEAIDALVRRNPTAATPPVLIGALLHPLLQARVSDSGQARREAEVGRLAESRLGPILKRMNVSRADSGRLKRICVVQRRFASDAESKTKKKSFRPASFLKQDYFEEALTLLRLRCVATDSGWGEYDACGTDDSDQVPVHTSVVATLDHRNGASRPASANARNNQRKDNRRKDKQTRNDSSSNGRRSRNRHDSRANDDRRDHNNERPSRKRKSRKRNRGRSRREEALTPLPPLPEIDLDPNQVPSYGSVLGDTGAADKIELESSKGKRARKRQKEADERYVPPPPKPDGGVPRHGNDPDVFGDW